MATLRHYLAAQREAIAQRDGRLFSYWNSDRSIKALDETTKYVSRLFSIVFDAGRVECLDFHDLRTRLRVARDLKMLTRYVSLHEFGPAQHLW